jgi:hypothetical protein
MTKRGIQALQSFPAVEIFESESKRKMELVVVDVHQIYRSAQTPRAVSFIISRSCGMASEIH